MEPKELPVYRHKDKILECIKNNKVVVIESPTGSGKTTQLPMILYEAGFSTSGIIGVTQPRRIATLSVCDYISRQLGCEVPGTVGYKMRFADETLPETVIKIMTDGILLQEIKHDPMLSKYSCLIVDEAHERSLNIDFILGLLKRISNEREDFKIIISSATINTSVFSEYFGGCPIVHIDSTVYPVGVIYDPVPEDAKPDELLLKTGDIVERCIDEERPGDILIFLSGEKMIKDCITMLDASPVRDKLMLLPLYGRLSKEEQERIFIPTPPGKTKVIVSTNIAETSVTIDGITTVIDSGLAKINTYNTRTFTSSLLESPISKASCNQRKGRAGRTQPGTCYRLYTKSSFENRVMFTKEEIYRTDLSEVILRMAELGITDFESFDFISSPERSGIRSAVETLVMLEALNTDNTLTKIGEMMAVYPLLPRLSRILVEAILKYPDIIEETIIAVTFLSTNSPFLLPQGEEMEARKAHHSFRSKYGDFVSYIDLYDAFLSSDNKEKFCESKYLDIKVMNEIVSIKEQLEDIVSEQGIPISSGGCIENYLSAIGKGLIQFVCARTGKEAYSSLTAERIFIHPGSVMFRENPDFIVAGEIVRTSKMYAHSVSPLSSQVLKNISPELAQKLQATAKAEKAEKAAAETPWQIKIGNQLFELHKGSRGKKKMATLPWEQLKHVLPSFVADNKLKDLHGKITYKGMDILTDEKMQELQRIVPYIDPEFKFVDGLPFNGSINSRKNFQKIIPYLDKLLYLCKPKKGKGLPGFLSLCTDERGNYWMKGIKSFDSAVLASLSSLEIFTDEVPENADPKSLEKLNSVYRYFSDIL
ncbi:MAG: ATP-dependent RNA helicase [Spirochaetia bacterium]|nr:ATP-dependent RNA helicase [Spirochaetia bacterium]